MKNAARVSMDVHQCPAVTGIMPHLGGTILTGASSVLIGGQPAARVEDQALCVGPPDAIKRGAPLVLIENKNAARRGDGTVHGGVIMTGHPMVLIGGMMSPGSDADSIQMAMDQIRASDFAQTPEGERVLAKLEELQKEGKILYGTTPEISAGAAGEWTGEYVVITPSYDRSPDLTASELVHEGTHGVHADDLGHSPNSIDEETQTNQSQLDYYQEQRQSGTWDKDLEERRQASLAGNLRGDVQSRYQKRGKDAQGNDIPDMPEHEP